MKEYYDPWRLFLTEAPRDAKVLRNINLDFIKKEVLRTPDEEIRDYFERIQQMERSPQNDQVKALKVFPSELVDWVEQLSDEHFPRNGRKMFAKWLGNAIYFEETEVGNPGHDAFENLDVYTNDIRYFVDYLNGAQDLPNNLWDLRWSQMYTLAREWHETLKGVEVTGDYETKEVVWDFKNGYTMVLVPSEDLSIEGEYMGHCVGGYCDSVASGRINIYSLRDGNNRPHATIEVISEKGFVPPAGQVQQIKGKGNAAPAEKYRPMIKQWLRASDFSYQDSSDYWAMLSEEEIIEKLETGNITWNVVNRLARETSNSQILEYLVATAGTDGQNGANRIPNFRQDILIHSLASNRFLSEDQIIRVVEIDLEIGALGSSVDYIFHETYREFNEVRPSGRVLAPLIWDRFKDKITENINEYKIWYLSSIIKYSDSEPLGREIVNMVLEEEVVDSLVKPRENTPYDTSLFTPAGTTNAYSELVQNYLLHNHRHDHRETLDRIYKFTRTLKGEILVGSYRVDSYISKSTAITSEIVNDMLSDKADPPGLNVKKNLILNPSVDEKYKYGILKRMLTGDKHRRAGNPIVKQLGTLIWREKHFIDVDSFGPIDRGIFSEKFLLWCLHSGVFDKVVEEKIQSGRAFSGQWEEKEYEKEKQLATDLLRSEISEIFSGPKEENFIDEQINSYLSRRAPVEDFYKKIEIGFLGEEKGRSRQRGIYKFYCMLSYDLTHDDRHSRGLDDILADLRAIPNVTIVTVVVRNQKVSEGRYIAGLSIKFIPSIPGEFNSPEDVKIRIVSDTRKLKNVKSIFKISAGLERIE